MKTERTNEAVRQAIKMENKYIAFCVLLLQLTWIHGSPANKEIVRPRPYFSPANTHIFGGNRVQIEKVPYQLSLRMFWLHTCGAVLVSPEYALTAAHCDIIWDLVQSAVSLTAGSTIWFMGGHTEYPEKVVPHPNFDSSLLDYDVAVIKMQNPFPITTKIKPVPLPKQHENKFLDYDVLATVSGWGYTESSFKFLPIAPFSLRKADVPLIGRDTCQALYRYVNDDEPIIITPRMICAGGITDGDACEGDSGGPLVHKEHLIGVVSWGEDCNVFPGVYTNLLHPEIRSFIAQHTDL